MAPKPTMHVVEEEVRAMHLCQRATVHNGCSWARDMCLRTNQANRQSERITESSFLQVVAEDR